MAERFGGHKGQCILGVMNKRLIVVAATIGMVIGGTVPVVIGVDDGFGLWSILGGFIGGITGIWIGIKLANRFE